ncbi:MAG: Fimbrial assembly protein [Verrucomicrobia bacterium]|nr:Fimbrial assembly protein [Verrucomicrobiota bacterium]
MPSFKFTCIDVGASRVVGAVVRRDAREHLTLEKFACAAHSADPAKHAEWDARTADALRLIAQRLLTAAPALIAVPPHMVLTKTVKTPSVARAQRTKVIPFEASQVIPFPLAEVTWDYEVVADDGHEMEIRFTAIKSEAMERLCAQAEEAGLRIRRAVSSPQALLAAFRGSYPDGDKRSMVVDIGARSSTLMLVEGGRNALRSVALGGNAVTAELAALQGISFEEAEAWKARPRVRSGHRDAQANDQVERAMGAFATQVELELARFRGIAPAGNERQNAESFYLAGGGSRLAGLAERLEKKLGIQVRHFDVLRNLTIPESVSAEVNAAGDHVLVNLFGLAALAGEGTDERATALLPAGERQKIAFARRRPFLVAGAALLVIALGFPAWHFQGLLKQREDQAKAIEAELGPMRLWARTNAENLRRIAEIKEGDRALTRWFTAKTEWLDLLSDLQDTLVDVEDVWLDRLQCVPARPAGVVQRNAVKPAEAPLEFLVSGRLLDAENPVSKVSAESYERVRLLFSHLLESPFIAAIKNERFDNSQPGLLKFDFSMVLNLGSTR